MPLSYQPTGQVRSVRVAGTERPVVAVRAMKRADHGLHPDLSASRPGRLHPALVALACAATGLLPFWSVDALESHPLAGHNERIGIDDPRWAADNIGISRLGQA